MASRRTWSLFPVAALAAVSTFAVAFFAMQPVAVAETPAWAKSCAATTSNPWIKSGYCESHQLWDKYYCKCDFVPNHNLFNDTGRGKKRNNLDTLDNNIDLDATER